MPIQNSISVYITHAYTEHNKCIYCTACKKRGRFLASPLAFTSLFTPQNSDQSISL